MDNDNFEKRMDFLKKSYERVPSSFDPDEVFKKIDEEKVPDFQEKRTQKNGGFRQRFTVWAVSIASIFIIGLIGTGLVLDQKNNSDEENLDTVVTDDYIEELQQKYEIEKEKRREMLKLDEEHFEIYVEGASIWLLNNKDFVQSAKQNANANEVFLDTYNRAIEELKTPSEMIQDLKRQSLVEDEQRSIEFITTFREKVQRLVTIYDQILEENREAIDAYEVDASVDKAEIMMLSSNSFPEQLQNIINTMKEQSIRLYTGKYTGEVKSKFYLSRSAEDLPLHLHDFTNAYISMIADEPYMYAGVLEYTVPETVGTLQSMERTLMLVERDSSLYPIMETYFVTLFNEILKGSTSTKIFDSDGVLLPEYQEAWNNLAYSGDATPLTYIMRPIVAEMKASGWRSSEQWNSLHYNDIEEALVLYREGVLAEYMYGEQPVFEDNTVKLPNEAFEQEVEALYKEFKKSYDKSVFKDISPTHVVGVFNYANEMEDPKTMYRLFHESYSEVSGTGFTEEAYIQNWRKGVSLFRKATDVNFTNANVQRYEHSLYAFVSINNGEETKKSIPLIYGENNVWEIRDMWLDRLPSFEQTPEIQIDDSTKGHMKELYKNFKRSRNSADLFGEQALTVMSLYLHAGALEDYETQYALFYHEDGSELIEKEKFVQDGERYSQPYQEDMYTSMSFKGLEEDSDGNWPGIATFMVNQELYPNLPAKQEFQMMWTEDGWRVKFQPSK